MRLPSPLLLLGTGENRAKWKVIMVDLDPACYKDLDW